MDKDSITLCVNDTYFHIEDDGDCVLVDNYDPTYAIDYMLDATFDKTNAITDFRSKLNNSTPVKFHTFDPNIEKTCTPAGCIFLYASISELRSYGRNKTLVVRLQAPTDTEMILSFKPRDIGYCLDYSDTVKIDDRYTWLIAVPSSIIPNTVSPASYIRPECLHVESSVY